MPTPALFSRLVLRILASGQRNRSYLEDVDELFSERCHSNGKTASIIWLWREIFLSLPAFISDSIYWRILMFKNYCQTALRNMIRHKGYTLINIGGLAIGIAVCLFILLWVKDETGYDRFHVNSEELYRVTQEQHYTDGTVFSVAVGPDVIGPALKQDFGEVVETARLRISNNRLITLGEEPYYADGFLFADPSFLSMFTFPLVKGNPETAISGLKSMVISERAAARYFGTDDPVGQTIILENNFGFQVTGIIKDVPANSHLQFDFIGNFEVLTKVFGMSTGWNNNNYYTYVQVRKDADVAKLKSEVFGFKQRHLPETTSKFFLQPLKDIHLRSNYAIDMDGQTQDRSQYVFIFTAVAVFVLLIACVNFMNLATARAGLRSKEVGMRKVVGARRTEIIRQFFGESWLFAIFACLTAVGAVILLIPLFNQLVGKTILRTAVIQPDMLLFVAAMALAAGLLSGTYPALFLSSFQPVSVLKGKALTKAGSAAFRKALVVFQFSLSIIFIAGSLIISDQLGFMRNRDLGFNKEALIHFRSRGDLSRNYTAFKSDLLQLPGIKSLTRSSDLPTYTVHSTSGFGWEGMMPDDNILMHHYAVDEDFANTLEFTMAEGRFFSADRPADRKGYVVNEAAVRHMGMEDPIGKTIRLWRDPGPIIGIVKDFHFKSLHKEIEPLLLRVSPDRTSYVLVRISTTGISGILKEIERIHRRHNPSYPFDFAFLDESLDSLYRADRRVGAVSSVFTGLAIFISCLGLFGLASFLIERRTREIGIRKILGADFIKIVGLLSSDFLKWVAVSNLIALPAAYFAMNKWLDNFAYRTEVGIGIFVLSAASALLIAIITISYHAVRTARSNPADSLRYE